MGRTLSIALITLGFAGLTLASLPTDVNAQAKTGVHIEIDGQIMPPNASFLSRAIDKAVEDGAELLVVELNTPGGLLDTTDDMVNTILDAKVAVVVFVSPSGSRAASAGTFVVAAAHVAAMAPGTNIGAASPVGEGGQNLPIESRIIAFDAIDTIIMQIVARRDRDEVGLRETVERAASYSAHEAVDAGVVDLVAQDIDDLLRQIDGRTVIVDGREKTLSTENLVLTKVEKTFLENFLNFLSDPNVAFMLIAIGFLGIWLEWVVRGALAFAPGITGLISLALATAGLSNLPVSWIGIALLVFAAILLIAETDLPGFGYFGVAGTVSLLLGGLFLFGGFTRPDIQPPSFDAPEIQVNLYLLVGLTAGVFVFWMFVLRDMLNSRTEGTTSPTSPASIVGQTAVAISTLSPRGSVTIGGEEWSAVTHDRQAVEQGRRVEVVGQDGLVLQVKPSTEVAESD